MIRRIVNSDLESAPDDPWVSTMADTVNKLVDNATATTPQAINLIKQANIEVVKFSVQVPDPWYTVGTSPAPSFENSFTGTLTYVKAYDGMIQVDASVSAGTAATVFHLPSGFKPKATVNFVAFDGFTGVATSAQVLADGSFKILGVGAHACTAHVTFMASDVTPIVQKCFPVNVKTALKSVSGVLLWKIDDVGNAGSTAHAENGGPVNLTDYTTINSTKGMQIQIKNIMGLPYNRKYDISLLVIGGEK